MRVYQGPRSEALARSSYLGRSATGAFLPVMVKCVKFLPVMVEYVKCQNKVMS